MEHPALGCSTTDRQAASAVVQCTAHYCCTCKRCWPESDTCSCLTHHGGQHVPKLVQSHRWFYSCSAGASGCCYLTSLQERSACSLQQHHRTAATCRSGACWHYISAAARYKKQCLGHGGSMFMLAALATYVCTKRRSILICMLAGGRERGRCTCDATSCCRPGCCTICQVALAAIYGHLVRTST
jgi:hypothetical protein